MEKDLSLWYEQPASKWEEALPKEFSEGSISGVCLRGGFELSMEWKDMKVTNWEITRRKAGNDHTTNDAGSKDERFSNTSNAGKGLTELTVLVNGEEQVLKL